MSDTLAASSEAGTTARQFPIRFHGTTGDYFRIWIVNMALTVVTLGIYSAWAKVRKLRYFYNNTELDGATFEYHATPVAILIGRIIAISVLAAYLVASYYRPEIALGIIVVVMLLIPVLVVRAYIFQLRNASYRQVRFGFKPNYTGAFMAYYVGALIAVISFGLAAPHAIYLRHRFFVDNAGFGTTPFRFKGESGGFFSIYYAAAGLGLLGMVAVLILMMVAGPFLGSADLPAGSPARVLNEVAITLPIFAIYAAIGVYTLVRQRNYIWSNTALGETTFSSTLSVRHMIGLYLTNILAIVVTLGLAIPWAQIRLARYRAGCTEVIAQGDWRQYLADQKAAGSSVGEELGDAFDVGVDLGI